MTGLVTGKPVAVAGASGTIGRAVVRECAARGFAVTALVRSEEAAELAILDGAQPRVVDMSDPFETVQAVKAVAPETVISCMASRTGSPKDALAVDLDANLCLLLGASAASTSHFILLSAICVQRPKLAFQRAKLAFEAALVEAAISHTIVRPTAFFKSLSGQVERVREGKPFLLFGNGELTRCKPISDADLARFIADCVEDETRRGKVLPIGGPGPAITLRQQGELIFEEAGREPRFKSVPPALFVAVSRVLTLGAPFSAWLAEKAEYARIAHYYATQSMLVLDSQTGEYDAEATPEFGSDTLRDHYRALLGESS